MTISDLLQHIIQKASSIIGLNSCNWQLIDRRRDYRPHCAFICSPDYQESVYSFYFMSDKNTVFTWLCIKIMNVILFFFFMQVNIDSNDSTFQTYKYIQLNLVFAVLVRLWRRLTQLPTKDPFYQDHDAYLDKTTSISIYNCQLKILTVSLSDWRVWLGLWLWYLVQCWIECSDAYTCMLYFLNTSRYTFGL